MTVSDGDLVRGTMEYTAANTSQVLNVFYWEYSGSDRGDPGFIDDMETWLEDQWHAAWDTIASIDYTIVDMRFDIVTVAGLLVHHIGTAVSGLAGAITGEPVASGVCGYLQADTDTPKVRGRKFIPGFATQELINSEWTAAAGIALLNLVAEWLTPVEIAGGGDLTPGVLASVIPAFTPFKLTGVSSTIPAYQRRRKKGAGS